MLEASDIKDAWILGIRRATEAYRHELDECIPDAWSEYMEQAMIEVGGDLLDVPVVPITSATTRDFKGKLYLREQQIIPNIRLVRLITPSYMFDIDDLLTVKGMKTFKTTLQTMAKGIVTEMCAKQICCRARIKLFIKVEAYTLFMFAYGIVGYAEDKKK